MSGEPIRLRALWWIMVRAERLAGWCRARWLRWHETGGVVLPSEPASTVRDCCVSTSASRDLLQPGQQWTCECGQRWRVVRAGQAIRC